MTCWNNIKETINSIDSGLHNIDKTINSLIKIQGDRKNETYGINSMSLDGKVMVINITKLQMLRQNYN